VTPRSASIPPPAPTHIFSLVTRDKPGVLVRIALVFARRGYNIDGLAVSPGATDGFARMTIMSHGDPENSDQIIKQLAKLVDVVFVTDHRGELPVEIEVALIKLCCAGEERKRALALAEKRGARLANDSDGRVILTYAATSEAINAFVAELAPCTLEELVRSGKIVMDAGTSRFAHLLGAGQAPGG
jgi:acetolactate synthase-1/3 small subunit